MFYAAKRAADKKTKQLGTLIIKPCLVVVCITIILYVGICYVNAEMALQKMAQKEKSICVCVSSNHIFLFCFTGLFPSRYLPCVDIQLKWPKRKEEPWQLKVSDALCVVIFISDVYVVMQS